MNAQKYYVENDFFVAPTVSLDDNLFAKFLKKCKRRERSNISDDVSDHEKFYIAVEYRDNWDKTEDDIKIESDAVPFYATIIKIYPEAILKDAPDWFIDKRSHYEELEKRYENDMSSIPDVVYPCLQEIKRIVQMAKTIRDTYQGDKNEEQKLDGTGNVAGETTKTLREKRDAVLYNLANEYPYWKGDDIVFKVNGDPQFEKLQTVKWAAAKVGITRHCKKHNLPEPPERPRGRSRLS